MSCENGVMLDEFAVKYLSSELPPDRDKLQTVLNQRNLQEEEKIKIFTRMSGGKTILHVAARRGHHEVLTIMLGAIRSKKRKMELLLQSKKITWYACYNPFTRCNTVLHEAVYAPQEKKEVTVNAILELDGLQPVDKFTLLSKPNDRGFTALNILDKMGDNYKLREMMSNPKRHLTALEEVLRAEIEQLKRQLLNQQQDNERRNVPINARPGRDGQQKIQSVDCSSSDKWSAPEKKLCYSSTEKSSASEANNQLRYSPSNLTESDQRLSD